MTPRWPRFRTTWGGSPASWVATRTPSHSICALSKSGKRPAGPDDPGVAVTLGTLAVLYRKQSRYEEAEELQRRTLDIAERTLGKDHPTYTTRLINLGALYSETGDHEAAEPLYAEALEIDERVLGPDHPYIATDLHNLATLYMHLSRPDEAEPLLQRALRIDRALYGDVHEAVGTDLLGLGRVQERLGRPAEAEAYYDTAVQTLEAALGPTHRRLAEALTNLTSFYTDEGRLDEAERIAERALTILENDQDLTDHPALAMALHGLAVVHRGDGPDAECRYPVRARPRDEGAFVGAHPRNGCDDAQGVGRPAATGGTGQRRGPDGGAGRGDRGGTLSSGPDHRAPQLSLECFHWSDLQPAPGWRQAGEHPEHEEQECGAGHQEGPVRDRDGEVARELGPVERPETQRSANRYADQQLCERPPSYG